MARIMVEHECFCFKKSGYENAVKYKSMEAAKNRADDMAEDMNESFCGKHNFSVVQFGDDIVIKVNEN